MDSKDTKDSYSHILKYTGLFGGVQGLNLLISLVRSKVVAILLGPDGMGLVSLFNSVIAFVSQGTSLGVSFSAIRQLSEAYESGDNERIEYFIKVLRSWSFLAALLGMLVCVLIGPILNRYTFSWGDHTLHFVLLAPVVGMMAVTAGETAILKGCRRLKSLAIVQVWTVVSALIISAPIYYFFGQSGIIPVFVLAALAAMLIVVAFSYHLYPLCVKGNKKIFADGLPMVKLGIAFVLGAIFTTGAEVVVRSFLNVTADLDVVGLYNAGYTISIAYAGMVFTAMETDYFPRLSAVNHNTEAVNTLVNRQIEVSLLIAAPMLVAMIIFLPIIVPILLSSSFNPAVPMAQLAVLAMYFKAVTLPVAYINLAKGNSMAFLVFEAAYAVVFVALIVLGFNRFGLLGTGVALVAAHIVDLLMIFIFARLKYDYRVSSSACLYMLIQLPLGVSAYALTFLDNTILYIILGSILIIISLAVSLQILQKKTDILKRLKR